MHKFIKPFYGRLTTGFLKQIKMIIEKLENRRRHLGMRQNELAEKSGLTNAQLSLYINGKTEPGLGALTRWCEALGLEMTVIVKEDAKYILKFKEV